MTEVQLTPDEKPSAVVSGVVEVTAGDREAGQPHVYIAARFSRRSECNALGHILKARGCVITSRWTKPDCDHVLPTGLSKQAEDSERQRFAMEDVDDVRAADWTISLTEEPRGNSRGGRHVEYGLAIALGHRLTVIGPLETVFHHLPHVEHFETVEAFVASLPAKITSPRIAAEQAAQARIEAAVLAERERCAKICDQQAQDFLSPEYATGQPLSSFSERFACGQIGSAIRKAAS